MGIIDVYNQNSESFERKKPVSFFIWKNYTHFKQFPIEINGIPEKLLMYIKSQIWHGNILS